VLICCALLLAGVADLKREAQALMAGNPASDRAGEILRQAAQLGPDDAEAQYLLGRWALVSGRFELAVEAETKAVRLSPDNATARMQAWTIVAVASDQMNQAGKADEAFRQAWQIDRSLKNFDPNAAYEYIRVLERDHRDEEAAPLVAEVLRRVPEYGPAHLSIAKSLFARKADAAAAREAEAALATIRNYPEVERDAHYLLARVYLRLGMRERAAIHTQWMKSNP
jgi:tetratricopeptide (TPR) repeat protein